MSEITVRGIPEIVTQGEQLTMSASVEVDISVDATFLLVGQIKSCYILFHFSNPSLHLLIE